MESSYSSKCLSSVSVKQRVWKEVFNLREKYDIDNTNKEKHHPSKSITCPHCTKKINIDMIIESNIYPNNSHDSNNIVMKANYDSLNKLVKIDKTKSILCEYSQSYTTNFIGWIRPEELIDVANSIYSHTSSLQSGNMLDISTCITTFNSMYN